MLELGDKAPAITLPMADGGKVNLGSPSSGKGRVIYFYPKDDTPGCTTEAKDFSTLAEDFAALGVEVVGVSPDGVESHCKFKTKHDLSVSLASDSDKAAAEAYGVWVEKAMYGKKYMGVERATFLLDAKGRIVAAWHKVKVPGHAEAVLATARLL